MYTSFNQIGKKKLNEVTIVMQKSQNKKLQKALMIDIRSLKRERHIIRAYCNFYLGPFA